MHASVPEITAADVAEDAYLLDVREADEWAAGHAPGAHHMPMMQVPSRAAEIPAEQDVVVVCRVGSRSAQVVAYLLARGWSRVCNLDGGMYAWQSAGRPMVNEDGGGARVI